MSTNPSNLYDGFNFLVTIEGVPVATFTECTLPTVTIDAIEYREGTDALNATHDATGLVRFGDLTLKRGLSTSASNASIWDWVNSFIEGKGNRHNVTVSLLNGQRVPVITWTFTGCWPVKYESPPLNAKTSSVAIETFVLSVDGMTMTSTGGQAN